MFFSLLITTAIMFHDTLVTTFMSQQTWEQFYQKRNRFYVQTHPHIDKLVSTLKAHKTHTVLDIGCGSGRNSIALAKEGFKVKGIDFSKRAIGLAKKWAAQQELPILFQVGDIHKNLPYPDNSFDAVVAIDSIHYDSSESLTFTLSEISRVLRAKGILFVTLSTKTTNPLVTHLIFSEEEIKDLIGKYFNIINSSVDKENFVCILAQDQKDKVD